MPGRYKPAPEVETFVRDMIDDITQYEDLQRAKVRVDCLFMDKCGKAVNGWYEIRLCRGAGLEVSRERDDIETVEQFVCELCCKWRLAEFINRIDLRGECFKICDGCQDQYDDAIQDASATLLRKLHGVASRAKDIVLEGPPRMPFFVVAIFQQKWNIAEAQEGLREAMVDHIVANLQVEIEDNGDLKFGRHKYTVMDFDSVVSRRGSWSSSLQRLERALERAKAEQGTTGDLFAQPQAGRYSAEGASH